MEIVRFTNYFISKGELRSKTIEVKIKMKKGIKSIVIAGMIFIFGTISWSCKKENQEPVANETGTVWIVLNGLDLCRNVKLLHTKINLTK